jgi:hypothetical protein
VIHIEELKGIIKHRIQAAFSIYEADSQTKNDKIEIWKAAFNDECIIKNGRLRLNIPLNS